MIKKTFYILSARVSVLMRRAPVDSIIILKVSVGLSVCCLFVRLNCVDAEESSISQH